MNKKSKFDFADSAETDKRKDKIDIFTKKVLDPEEEAFFISDEASVYDISSDDDETLLNRIKEHYGVLLHSKDLMLSLWELIDLIEEELEKQKKRRLITKS